MLLDAAGCCWMLLDAGGGGLKGCCGVLLLCTIVAAVARQGRRVIRFALKMREKKAKKKIEEIQSSRRREGSWAPLFYSADYCLFIEMQEIRDGEKKKAQKNQIKWNEKKKKPRPADKAATSTFPSDRFSDEF